MAPTKFAIRFPRDGIIENAGFSGQPPTSSRRMLNALPFDPVDDAERGGQRPASRPYFDGPIDSTGARIQHLAQVVRTVSGQSIIAGTLIYTRSFNDTPQPSGLDESGEAREYFHTPSIASGTHPRLFDVGVSDGALRYIRNNDRAEIDLSNNYFRDGTVNSTTDFAVADNCGRGLRIVAAGTVFSATDRFVLRCTLTTFTGDTNAAAQYFAGFAIRLKASANECFLAGWHRVAGAASAEIGLWKEQNSGSTAIGTPSATFATDTNDHVLEVRVNKYYVEIYWDGALKYSQLLTGADGFDSAGHDAIGFAYSRIRSAATWASNLTAVPKFDTVRAWQGAFPNLGREVLLVAVTAGDVYSGRRDSGFTIPSGGDNALDIAATNCMSAAVYQKLYILDNGNNMRVYDSSTNVVAAMVASAGSLPGSATHRPTIIALWNGRLVFAGVDTELQNAFMSRVIQDIGTDEMDFDYTQIDLGAAVSLSTSPVGVMGDVIVSLMPFNRGPLLFGCQSQISILSGNPSPGGVASLSKLADVGVLGRRAWCFGPDGRGYIMCTDGLNQVKTDGFNVERVASLSRKRVDKTFREINPATHDVQVIWSWTLRGLIAFVTPTAEAAETTHWFWSERTGGFFPLQLPEDHGPTAVLNFNDDDPTERMLIMGGFDSWLRMFDNTAKNDHGTSLPFAIDSYFMLAPFRFAPADRSLILSVEGLLSDATDSVDVSLFAHDSPEAILEASPIVQRKWTGGGRTPRIVQRAGGRWLTIMVQNDRLNESWAIEELNVLGITQGIDRRAVQA